MRTLLVSLAALALVAGCGSGASNGKDTGSDPGSPDVQLTDLGGDTALPEDPGTEAAPGDVPVGDTAEGKVVKFSIDSLIPQQVPVNQKYTLEARVTDAATGAPVPYVGVSFAISRVEDLNGEEILESDGLLAPGYAAADQDGYARSTFTAGVADGLIYTIDATTEGAAAPAQMRLVVIQMDCACVETTFQFEGSIPSGATLKVYAYPSDVKCADLTSGGALPSPSFQAESTDTAAPVKLECVLGSKAYTLLATARTGCPVAVGCLENVQVGAAGGECAKPAVGLAGVKQQWPGAYDATTSLDFSAAFADCAGTDVAACATPTGMPFPQQACCYVAQVEALFQTPVASVADAFAAQARATIPSLVSEADATKLKDAALATLGAVQAPAWVATVPGMGARMIQACRKVTAQSTITLEQGASDTALAATEKWNGYTVYWKAGCDPADPEYFKCGKLSLATGALSGPYSPAIPDDTFTASLSGLNLVKVDKHVVKLGLGRLLAWVVNKVAIPVITGGKIEALALKGGAADLAGALGLWLDCETLSASLLDQVKGWFTGTQADLVTVCKAVHAGLLAPADKTLNALIQEAGIEIEGSAAGSDESCDLNVDRLTSGQYTGVWKPASGEPAAITGDFTATRAKD